MIIKLAMIFPGQVQQQNHVLVTLNKINNIIKLTFEESSEYLNYNCWNIINQLDNKLINFQYKQPILLTISVAIYRLWKSLGGINPIISSGHSLGEYSALVCSESIKFSDALQLLKNREKIINNQLKKHHMEMIAIIGLNEKIINKICNKNCSRSVVNIGIINSNNQIIISGHRYAVEKTAIECKQFGARCITIPLKIGYHCCIMKKIRRAMNKKIKYLPINRTQYPVINSITLTKYVSKHTIRKSLINQLFKTVQWKKTLDIIKLKSDKIIEISTNNTLTRMDRNNNTCISMNNIKNINYLLKLF